jgi:hypothetical protein
MAEAFPASRVWPAMAAGALTSALVLGALVAGEDVLVNGAKLSDFGFSFILYPGIIVWCAFMVGIATVGLPVWFLFHRRGWTQWWPATLAGGVEAFAAGAAVALLPMAGAHPAAGWMYAGFFAIAGSAGGWTTWRVAYRHEA